MANKETEGRIFLKQTAAELETSNPVLRDGQLFITKDGVAKIGDGATHWASLSPVIPNSMMKWHGQWLAAALKIPLSINLTWSCFTGRFLMFA